MALVYSSLFRLKIMRNNQFKFLFYAVKEDHSKKKKRYNFLSIHLFFFALCHSDIS
jgi:hypothetical protein